MVPQESHWANYKDPLPVGRVDGVSETKPDLVFIVWLSLDNLLPHFTEMYWHTSACIKKLNND